MGMLRTSENLDAFLKDEGWGYIMRKAAAAVTSYQTIEQTESQMKITVKNKKGEYTYTAPLDGSKITYVDNDKDNVESEKKKTLTRTMVNGEMQLRIENANNVRCVRIFKKD